MVRIARYFLLSVAALFCMAACHEKGEVIPDDILCYGEHKVFSLTDELRELKKKEVVCAFKDNNGNVFRRDASVLGVDKDSRLRLRYGLAAGKYMLLYVEFKSDNEGDRDGVERIGIGRYLEALKGKISVTGVRSSKYGFGGSGTLEDPYKINCDRDLYYLQGYVNTEGASDDFKGVYFEQTADIDLWDYSFYINFDYGWMPVGKTSACSFRGYYDGDGHKVSGMFINREVQSGVGLFGVLNDATVVNLTIEGAEITGDGAVGGVAGAVVADGDKRGGTLIKNCKVVNSKIKGNTGVGGVVGMSDRLLVLRVDSCETSENTSVTAGYYGAGGILGGGVTFSSVVLSGCTNRAEVSAGQVNAGGIAGGVDTAVVLSCRNFGPVTGLSAQGNSLGTGGILGGSGIANLIDVHNFAAITGYKGVGGLVGSTIVGANEDGSNAVYNNIHIQGSHNEGKISAEMMAGGLCGESQLSILNSYNTGEVAAAGDYAGGILGTTSVAAIHNANNFGKVSGKSNVGGIVGKVQQGSYAMNLNFGEISATGDNVGGIIGKTGNQSIIHYCSNFGTIRLSGEGSAGGIAGEIGDPREWSGWDIAEVVIGTVEIATAGLGTAFCVTAKLGMKAAMEVVHITHSVIDMMTFVANAVTHVYSINLLIYPEHEHITDASYLIGKLSRSSQEHDRKMEELIQAQLKAMALPDKVMNLSSSPLDTLMVKRSKVLDFYTASGENHEFFNERINETMAERYEEVEANKHHEEMVHTVLQGICMVLSVGALVLSIPLSGGASVAVAVAGVGVALVGGANAISKAARNYDANTLEISQCCNFGALETSGSAETGGIVGKMADFSLITDCINGGTYTSNDSPIVEDAGGKVTVKNCLDLYGTDLRKIADVTIADDYFSNNKILCYDKDSEGWDHIVFHKGTNIETYGLDDVYDILIPETLCRTASYSGWDFTGKKLWVMPGEGKRGSFPVPYISKMTVE